MSVFANEDIFVKSEYLHETIDGFKLYRLGPRLAYSIRKRIPDITAIINNAKDLDKLVLCFGEIDCRMHIVPQAIRQNKTIEQVAAECAHQYINVCMSEIYPVINKPIVFMEVHPSKRNTDLSNGSFEDRMLATKSFNQALGSSKLDVFNFVVDKDSEIITDMFFDNYHLSKKIYPFLRDQLIPRTI